jgi:uncharacterized protein (TIGR03437 family)
MVRTTWAFWICLPLLGQFNDLATTEDGSVVFFSTWHRRSGSSEPFHGRIYVGDATGIRLYAERQRIEVPGNPTVTSYYWLSSPEVSGDGRLVAFTGRRDCLGGRQCIGVQTTETTITGMPRVGDLTVRGRVRFSASRRYLLRYPTVGIGGDPGGLLDLSTGQEVGGVVPPETLAEVGRPLADDGSYVMTRNSTVRLVRGGQSEALTDLTQESAEDAVMDAAGKIVVYTGRWVFPKSAFSRIRVIEPGRGAPRTLIEGIGDSYQPVLSNDGQRVMFLSTSVFDTPGRLGPAQVSVIRIDGEELRRVTNDPSGIRTAILSGDGRIVYAVTMSGRLLRADLETGEQKELIPRTLSARMPDALVAGSPAEVTGVGYVGADGVPEPVRVRLAGREAPVLSLTPGRLIYQVPWELADQSVAFELELKAPPSPFEPPAANRVVWVSSRGPKFSELPEEYGTQQGYRFMKAVSGDFSHLITQDTPARPGSIINAYATGLGPVSPAIPTGEAAPSEEPLARVVQPVECTTGNSPQPVPVIFAGLAPGQIGVYQLQMEIPRDLPVERGSIQIRCFSPDTPPLEFFGYLPIR